jgi:alcohol dehydrogenase class IV
LLAHRLVALMRVCDIPNGVGGVGYLADDVATLTAGAWVQQRLIRNAPRTVDERQLAALFEGAMSYW